MADFRVLGPFDVVAEGRALRLGGAKQRAVLAVLVLRAGELVSTDAIVEAVWGDHAPSSATALVRTYVSRLRQLLPESGPGRKGLIGRSPGYLLDIDPDDIDVHRFEQLVDRAREAAEADRWDAAAVTLRRALGLWRGVVLADVPGLESMRPAIARLEEMRLAGVEDHVSAELALGHHVEVVSELEALTAQHPLRERLWGQFMLALYRSERQADALRAYQTARSTLRDQLGIDPGPDLQALEQKVLSHAGELDWRPPDRAHDRIGDSEPRAGAHGRLPLPATIAAVVGGLPLVGRSRERAMLARALEVACAGQFNAVFVAGPPGIGKTALVSAFAAEAHAEGARVVLGRADESAPVPLQAVREAISAWSSSAPAAELDRLADEDAEHLARLVPLLRRRDGDALAAPAGISDADRYLLFQAVTHWVSSLAADGPAVMILDDLHWADPATLLAVHYLLRHPPTAGALLVGTYRGTEIDDRHGLADVLTTTQGDPHVRRVALTGLNDREVADLLCIEAGGDIGSAGAALAAQLNRRTGGNPLFVHETLRHLIECGAIVPSAGDWADEQVFDELGIPPRVTELIQQRLKRLPGSTSTALHRAAVIGQTFDVPVLSQVVDMAPVSVIEALEPAVVTGLVDHVGPHGYRFAFSHSLVRDAIVDGLPLSQRTRAHWRAGQAIASVHAARPDAHLGAIARHLAAGVAVGDPRAAIAANVAAGEHALETLAFEDAAACFATAVELLETTGVDDPDLTYRASMGLGDAGNILADSARGRDGYVRAASLAREQQWPERVVRAAVGFGAYIGAIGELEHAGADGQLHQDFARVLLDEALDVLGDVPSLDRCLLLSIKAIRSVVLGQPEGAVGYATSAVDVAGSVDDPRALASALTARCWSLLGSPHAHELARSVGRAVALPSPSHGPASLSDYVLAVAPVPALQLGDRAGFDTQRAQIAARPDIRRSVHLVASVRSWEAAIALASGRFEDAKHLTSAIPGITDWPVWAGLGHLHAAVASYERGRLAFLVPGLNAFLAATPDAVVPRTMLASLHAQAGQVAEASRQISVLRQQRGLEGLGWSSPLALRHLAEATSHLDDAELAGDLLGVLSDYSGQLLTSFAASTIDGAADRSIGQLLVVLGELDEAVERLATAQELERSFGADALATRTALWHARARLRRRAPGDRAAAHRLLGQASSQARRLGMAQLERDTDRLRDQA